MARVHLHLVLLLTLVSIGHARQGEKPFARFDEGGAILAGERSVQAELKVTTSQSINLGRLFAGHLRDQRSVLEEWSKDTEPAHAAQYQKRLSELTSVQAEGVLALLDAEQRARLRQIALQQVGASALMDTAVAKAVGLSNEQSQKVAEQFSKLRKQAEALEAAIQKKMEGVPKPTSFEEAQAYQLKRMEIEKGMQAEAAAVERARRETDAAALAVLKPDQRKKWDALLGKPFRLPQ